MIKNEFVRRNVMGASPEIVRRPKTFGVRRLDAAFLRPGLTGRQRRAYATFFPCRRDVLGERPVFSARRAAPTKAASSRRTPKDTTRLTKSGEGLRYESSFLWFLILTGSNVDSRRRNLRNTGAPHRPTPTGVERTSRDHPTGIAAVRPAQGRRAGWSPCP